MSHDRRKLHSHNSIGRAALMLLLVGVLAPGANGVMHLKRDAEAPAITLTDQNSRAVNNQTLRDQIVILIFGETYHDKTLEACAAVDAVLQDPRLVGQSINAILVVTQDANGQAKAALNLPATVARDAERKTFGAYQVAVMPSVVVIDRQGRIVHAMAGMLPRFADLLMDSLLYASGKLSADNLERSLSPAPATPASESELRAERLAQLARQLMRRGLDEMASEKYAEALQLNPNLASAHLDLGTLLLKHKRLAEAEKQFRAVLAEDANSLQANLGVAFVQTLRGGKELDDAEGTVRAVLARSPAQPRAHYLLGLIQERRGNQTDAAASFKRASELLLERAEQE